MFVDLVVFVMKLFFVILVVLLLVLGMFELINWIVDISLLVMLFGCGIVLFVVVLMVGVLLLCVNCVCVVFVVVGEVFE